MSVEAQLPQWESEDVQPIRIESRDLPTTAPEYLRDLKYEYAKRHLFPARLHIDVKFDTTNSTAIEAEIETIQDYIRAAAFLGIGAVTITVGDLDDDDLVTAALAESIERAKREGIVVDIEGIGQPAR